jgi:capsid protein
MIGPFPLGQVPLCFGSFRRVAARCEHAHRTNAYAKRAVDVLKTCVVGGGIRPFPAAVDVSGKSADSINNVLMEDWKRANDEVYRIGSQPVSAMEAQGLEFTTMVILGSWLRQRVSARKGAMLPQALTIMKPTNLDFSRDTFFDNKYIKNPSGKQTILGQNMNGFFEPESFNIEGISDSISAALMSIHYRGIEAEQYLGIPWLTPIMTKLWDIEELFNDKLLQSRQLTRMGIWEKKENKRATSKILDDNDGDGEQSFGLEKLSTYYSDTKPEAIQLTDNLSDSFSALIKLALHAVAVGLGFSYGRLTTDLEGANYAGGRINLISDAKIFNSLFRQFVKGSCQSTWSFFVEMEAFTGRLGISYRDYLANPWGFSQCYHLPEGDQWVDPLKDAQAQDLLYKTGQITLQNLCAMQGTDYRSIIKQRSLEKQELVSANLGELLPSNSDGKQPIQEGGNNAESIEYEGGKLV